MQVKSRKNNYLTKSSEIPKSIRMFFLILLFMFGQDFGFGKSFRKKSANILKYYSNILSFTIFVIILLQFTLPVGNVWYWCTLTEYVVNFCILKSSKYNVFDLIADIHAAESIDILENVAFGVITSLYALGMFIAKVSLTTIICIFDNTDTNIFCNTTVFDAFHCVYFYAFDLMHDAQIIIRFYIYAYVKNMERSLTRDQDINKFIESYSKIADCQDKIRQLCDYLALMELVTNVPKLMASSWYTLRYVKFKRQWFTTMNEWIYVLHMIIQIAIPAVIMQLMKCRVDKIRQNLNRWSMVEKDPEKKAKITRVMKYMKVRSLHYKIWGIIPTDLMLPLALISICTTYLIVIIQFTHLYD